MAVLLRALTLMCLARLYYYGYTYYEQAKLPDDQSRIVSLHRDQPGCYDASLLYLRAGSMARRVGPQTARAVTQPTLVVWGSGS